VAGQCLGRGLVDEILVYVLPVLLGDGIPMSSPGLTRVDLEPISSARSGDATILRFRVRKESRPTPPQLAPPAARSRLDR
jgi:riboflavin biosynthesis pyrimidine reductase